MRRDAGEVGVALGDFAPPQPEARRELGAQRRGVDPADAALLVLQEPGVEGQPVASGVLDLGHDEGVGVQLWIRASAGVLSEDRHDKTLGVELEDAVGAPAGHRAVTGEPGQGGVHRAVVGGGDLGAHEGVVGQGPQHRHRLGGREGGVEAPGRVRAVAPTQALAGDRVARGEQGLQLLGRHLGTQAQAVPAVAPPPPGRFGWVEVVVDRSPAAATLAGLVGGQPGVVGDGGLHPVPAGLDSRHPHHRRRPSGGNALVCTEWVRSCPMPY